jgi:hypothetical protein
MRNTTSSMTKLFKSEIVNAFDSKRPLYKRQRHRHQLEIIKEMYQEMKGHQTSPRLCAVKRTKNTFIKHSHDMGRAYLFLELPKC